VRSGGACPRSASQTLLAGVLDLNRFSDPTGLAFGVIYLGASAKVAFVETVLRDRADGRGGDFMLDMAEIERRSLASIVFEEPLSLVDLTEDGRLRMGVPSDVVGASDQTFARAWSAAFHAHEDRPDGVFYLSRLNGQPCVALYDRAIAKLRATANPRLIECEVELTEILDDLDISIAP
jgi:hypothetical protein